MGAKSLRLFLNMVTASASNAQSVHRYVARLDAQASHSSTPSPPVISTHGWGGRWYQSVSGSPRQFISASKDPFRALRPMDLPAEPPPLRTSVRERFCAGDQESASNSGPWTLIPDTPAAIGRKNSSTLPLDAPHPRLRRLLFQQCNGAWPPLFQVPLAFRGSHALPNSTERKEVPLFLRASIVSCLRAAPMDPKGSEVKLLMV
jgi:hypothetical protein